MENTVKVCYMSLIVLLMFMTILWLRGIGVIKWISWCDTMVLIKAAPNLLSHPW